MSGESVDSGTVQLCADVKKGGGGIDLGQGNTVRAKNIKERRRGMWQRGSNARLIQKVKFRIRRKY